MAPPPVQYMTEEPYDETLVDLGEMRKFGVRDPGSEIRVEADL
jgi:hypothetical protein